MREQLEKEIRAEREAIIAHLEKRNADLQDRNDWQKAEINAHWDTAFKNRVLNKELDAIKVKLAAARNLVDKQARFVAGYVFVNEIKEILGGN